MSQADHPETLSYDEAALAEGAAEPTTELLPEHIQIGAGGVAVLEAKLVERLRRLAEAAEETAERVGPAPVGLRVDI